MTGRISYNIKTEHRFLIVKGDGARICIFLQLASALAACQLEKIFHQLAILF